MSKLMSVSAAARLLGVDPRVLRRAIADGRLTPVKLGSSRQWLSTEAVTALMAQTR